MKYELFECLSDAQVIEVMKLTAFYLTDQVFWRVDDGKLRLFLDCSDTFAWACSDAEEVLPSNFGLLCKALQDTRAFDESMTLGPSLFCSRARNCKPMPQWFDHWAKAGEKYEKCLTLFDDLGPTPPDPWPAIQRAIAEQAATGLAG